MAASLTLRREPLPRAMLPHARTSCRSRLSPCCRATASPVRRSAPAPLACASHSSSQRRAWRRWVRWRMCSRASGGLAAAARQARRHAASCRRRSMSPAIPDTARTRRSRTAVTPHLRSTCRCMACCCARRARSCSAEARPTTRTAMRHDLTAARAVRWAGRARMVAACWMRATHARHAPTTSRTDSVPPQACATAAAPRSTASLRRSDRSLCATKHCHASKHASMSPRRRVRTTMPAVRRSDFCAVTAASHSCLQSIKRERRVRRRQSAIFLSRSRLGST
eukprot:2368072-Rhodomonas_salina.9